MDNSVKTISNEKRKKTIIFFYLSRNNESTKSNQLSNQLNIKEIFNSKENTSIMLILLHIKSRCIEKADES